MSQLGDFWFARGKYSGADRQAGELSMLVADEPTTIVRSYRGKPGEALPVFDTEARTLADYGYRPTAQVWSGGQWGLGAYLAGVLLILLFGFGLLILGYLVIVKPAGVLTVTYGLTPRAQVPEPAEPTKVCPRCAETVKVAALVCRYCGHEFS